MTMPVNQLLQQALQLPVADREQFAEHLYLSVHSVAEIDSAWTQEIAERISQVDAGKVSLISADDAHQQIQRLIDRGRQDS